jgi:TonB-linked SusC/RagA family outer membrane protein
MKKNFNQQNFATNLLKFDLKMKLTTLLFFVSLLCLHANDLYAQKAKVSLDVEKATVKEVIDNIESSTKFKFIYNTEHVNLLRELSLKFKNERIDKVLEQIFVNTNTNYKVKGTQLILYKSLIDKVSKASTIDRSSVEPIEVQSIITGTITDENGVPLAGASIVEKGTINGTQSDFDGKFSITVEDDAILLVSYIGFRTTEILVNGQSSISVSMQEDAAGLDEVVVVGYGTMESREVSSAITTVQNDRLNPTGTNFTQGLQGVVAGLSVMQTTGQPGGGMDVKIRDNPSFASAGVLYVVDGVPINEAAEEAGTSSQYNSFNVNRSPLNYLNTNDIESISVLKDASATAIYGARAGAGVVLITTKKGTSDGKSTINYNNNFSFRKAIWEYDILDSGSYMVERNRIARDSYLSKNSLAPYGSTDPSTVGVYSPIYTDNEITNAPNRQNALEAISNPAIVADHNISISGGNSKTTYYVSANYLSEEGVVSKSDFKRFGGRVRIDNSISDKLKIGVNVSYNKSDSQNPKGGGGGDEPGNRSESGIIESAFGYPANIPFIDLEGNYTENPDLVLEPNPLSFFEIDDNTTNTRLLASGNILWNFLPGFTANVRSTYDESESTRGLYLPNNFYYGARTGGLASIANQNSFSKTLEMTLDYSKDIGENARLSLLGGYSYQETIKESLSGKSTNFITDDFSYNNLSAGRQNVETSSFKSSLVWASYFGRAALNWNNFNLTGSIRYDGSSNFSKDNKFGLFPAVSASYNLVGEDNPLINMLKPRVGYGLTGNSAIGSNAFSIYSTGIPDDNFYANYVFGTTENVGVFWQQLNNDNLTWETVSELNFGVDFKMLNNRIAGTLDYFNKTIDNLLSFRPLPTDFPVARVADNVGKTRTKGWEFALNTKNIVPSVEDGFGWNTNITLARYTSDWVERSPEVINTLPAYVGLEDPFNAFYGYTSGDLYTGGVAPAWMPDIKPGTIIIKDINGFDSSGVLTGIPDGKLTTADISLLGRYDPKLSFGLNNTFSYKQFDLSVFTYGFLQNKANSVFARSYSVESQLLVNGSNILREVAENRWSYNNQESSNPSGIAGRYLDLLNGSDYFFEKADFIRIGNIAIGYSLPSLISKLKGLSSARINLRIENPFVFSVYKGGDPELASTSPYPITRNIVIGLNISF